MAQKSDWACRSRICARLEDSDQIPDFCRRKLHGTPQGIERSTQGANDVHSLSLGSCMLVQNSHGEVALDDLSQVSRGRQVMIHASIQNQVLLSTRTLDIRNPRNVHTRLADQEAPRLHHEFGIRQAIISDAIDEPL